MRRVTMAIAMAVLAAACAGNGAEETEEAEGEEEELSLGDFGLTASREDFNPRAMQMEAQEKIAECMTAEGWEYTPYVGASVSGGLGFSELDEEEYRKTYGFGIATQSLLLKEMLEAEQDDKATDPNAEIVKGMSEDERAAYNTALYGEIAAAPTQEELEAMTEEELAELNARQMGGPGGCTAQAWSQAFPAEAFFEEFGDALDDAFDRASAEPRIVKADADWSACMAERGHEFASQEEMYTYLYGDDPLGGGTSDYQKRVKEASGSLGDDVIMLEDEIVLETDEAAPGGDVEAPPGTALGGDAEAPPGAAPGDDVVGGDVVISDIGQINLEDIDFGVDMEKLQPLIDGEISMAVADWECGEDLRLLRQEVFEEMERDFINNNRDRLLEFQKRNQ